MPLPAIIGRDCVAGSVHPWLLESSEAEEACPIEPVAIDACRKGFAEQVIR